MTVSGLNNGEVIIEMLNPSVADNKACCILKSWTVTERIIATMDVLNITSKVGRCVIDP